MIPPPPRSTLFPYTTLFRSLRLRFRRRLTASVRRHRMYPYIIGAIYGNVRRSEEHTSELQSRFDLVCRLLLEKKKKIKKKKNQLNQKQTKNNTRNIKAQLLR